MDQDEIAVIIPCFNEAQTIGKVVDDFHRELPEATVYVYDNASTDATAAIAMKHGATVRYEPRRGKGECLPPDVPEYRCRLLPHGGRGRYLSG